MTLWPLDRNDIQQCFDADIVWLRRDGIDRRELAEVLNRIGASMAPLPTGRDSGVFQVIDHEDDTHMNVGDTWSIMQNGSRTYLGRDPKPVDHVFELPPPVGNRLEGVDFWREHTGLFMP